MKRTLLTLALATGLATAGAASAQRYYAPTYDYARVVDVDPIVARGSRPVSREVCYDERAGYDGYYGNRVERRCRVETAYRGGQNRVVGYDVTYVYNGRTFRTQTNQHPGRRIRVAVDRYRDDYAYRY